MDKVEVLCLFGVVLVVDGLVVFGYVEGLKVCEV